MKTAGRLLAVLLSALMIAASLGCSLMPTNAGGGGEKETKAPVVTTAVPTEAAQEDDLIEVRTLYRDLYQTLTKAETSVVYDDPAVGQKLRASSTLVKDGETLTYRAPRSKVPFYGLKSKLIMEKRSYEITSFFTVSRISFQSPDAQLRRLLRLRYPLEANT